VERALVRKVNHIENPWVNLPTAAPYLLQQDRLAIETFNRIVKDQQHRIHDDILPEPFLGLPESDVVLLNLNPGFSTAEVEYHHLDRYFKDAALANLAHQEQPYPFYFLDPAVKSPGHQWWQRRLGTLIQQFTAETLARRLLCLEFFPYHSERFDRATPRVPSQGYTFALLRQAIERGAVIVVMRARELWFEAVPELCHAGVHRLNSTQAVYITPGNCPEGYPEIVKRLSR
jgi:hypothetical protein